MKKRNYFIVLVVVILLTVCLSACKDNSEIYRKINVMLREDYSKVTVEVVTEKDGITLNGNYEFVTNGDKVNVSYAYDKLNSFEVNGGAVTSPDDFKTRVIGTAVVQNGSVTEINGGAIESESLTQLNASSITFRKSLLTNVKVTDYTLQADVVNAKEFTGNDAFDGTNVKVRVGFRKYLDKIELTYEQNGTKVSVTYKFSK